MPLSIVIASAAVAASVPLLWWAVASARQPGAAAVARNLSSGYSRPTDLRSAILSRSARERAVEPAIQGLAQRARRFTPVGMVEQLEHKMVLAGVGHWGIDRVLAAKLGLGLVGGVLGLAVWIGSASFLNLLMAILLTAIGWFGVDFVLSRRARERQLGIERDLADTLDQITISVEAGLGFEAAVARTAQSGSGPLAQELGRMLQDVQLGIPRREALAKLVARTDVADLRRFVQAIAQAESYGVPIAQVLRIQSAELRTKRRQRAEERAMKIPVKIVFPLIFCILPTLFIVIIGPGAIRIIEGGGIFN